MKVLLRYRRSTRSHEVHSSDLLSQPGGQDSQVVLPDSLHTYVSTNYLLRTTDDPPAFIAVQTTGWRKGPREVLERLFDSTKASDVNPSEYSFRLTIKLETGDERYSDIVNGAMWIGSGARMASEGLKFIAFDHRCIWLIGPSDIRCVSCKLALNATTSPNINLNTTTQPKTHGRPLGYGDSLVPAAQLSFRPSKYLSFTLLTSTPSCG